MIVEMPHRYHWFSPPKTAYVGLGIVSWQGCLITVLTVLLLFAAIWLVSNELLSIATSLGIFFLYIIIVKLTGGRFTNPDAFSLAVEL